MTGAEGFATRCIHAGEGPDPVTGAHGIPLFQNVTYAFTSYAQVEAMRAGERPHFSYSPRGNPTVRSLEVKLANLEGTETSLALNSGMAAISATILTLLASGGHVVASCNLFSDTRAFFRDDLPTLGCGVTFVDTGDLDAVEAAITADTRVIYCEPFSNPNLHVTDPRPLADIARRHDLTLVVDNTFLSPALFRPVAAGADIVIHSATKYISGNGQVQGGVVSGPRRLIDPMKERALRLGSVMSPFAAWLLLAGVHTLALRMARHSENAMRLARLLAAHPAVSQVNYPGLETHPGHALATSMVGSGADKFGGMLSFELHGGNEAIRAFLDSLRIATIAVSLGDTSTLAWPWPGTSLVRISTGLEDAADLEADFTRALSAVQHRVVDYALA